MAEATKWADIVLRSFVDEVNEGVAYVVERGSMWKVCESPIERAFAQAFTMIHGFYRGAPLSSPAYSLSGEAPQMFFAPQFAAGPYRVDFLIGFNIGEHRHTSIVVECDGHDFHERSKQQAARDKKRDRYLSNEFARVIRFTGSEIYASPCKCANEAYDLADAVFWAWYSRGNP
jgi:very-short-patch-repair endonuclease